MIVMDASAIVAGLARPGIARDRLAHDPVHVPHLADHEVLEALRKLSLTGAIDHDHAGRLAATWAALGVRRHPAAGLLDRAWQLRHNLSMYDAAYVALAEALECPLITADRRLAGATGPNCAIEIVPR